MVLKGGTRGTIGRDRGLQRGAAGHPATNSASSTAAAPVCRYWTDLTAQFNTRIMPVPFDRFYQIADEQGWKIGETVERALAALERELGQLR